jgi:aminoglycoside phosphotransferase (APT) family kinase protein
MIRVTAPRGSGRVDAWRGAAHHVGMTVNLLTLRGEVARLLAGRLVDSVTPLGEGADHRAFAVDGRYVVRVAKTIGPDTAAAAEREMALLAALAGLGLPVPEPVAMDPPRGLMVVTLLPGRSLQAHPSAAPSMLIPPLAEILSTLAAAPGDVTTSLADDRHPMPDYLAEATADFAAVAAALDADDRRLVEAFLAADVPPEPGRTRACHNDLGAEHLLATHDGTRLTGVIDWSDAALADPARDVALLLRDLGAATARAVVARSGVADDDGALWPRAVFLARCALLEDLAYGVREGQPLYARRAHARLPALFAPEPT